MSRIRINNNTQYKAQGNSSVPKSAFRTFMDKLAQDATDAELARNNPQAYNEKKYAESIAVAPSVQPGKTRVQPQTAQEVLAQNEWSIGIVNHSVTGVKLENFGYLSVNCQDAADGELVFVNANGEVQLIEQADQLSEDMRAKIDGIKQQYGEAKHEYDVYMGIQTLAKPADDLINTDPNNVHQVNSAMDLLVNVVSEAATNLEKWYGISNVGGATEPVSWEHTQASVQELWQRSTINRVATNAWIEHTYGKDWKEQFSGSTENYEKLMNLDVDDTVKAYMAWQITQPDYVSDADSKGLGFTHFMNNLGAGIGDNLDYLANLPKAIITWADDKYLDGRVDKSHDYSDETLVEAIAAGYAPTWSETGRRTYNYDTGSFILDLGMEILSDPQTWVTFGLSGAAKGVATGTVEALLKNSDQLAEQVTKEMATEAGERAFRSIVKAGVQEGLPVDKIAARLAAHITDPKAVDDIIPIITDAIEYSNNFVIARSLGATQKVFDTVDFMASIASDLGPAIIGVRQLGNVAQAAKNAAVNHAIENQVFKDTYTTITASTDGILHPADVNKLCNMYNMRINGLGVDDTGKVLAHIDDTQRAQLFTSANDNTCSKIENILNDLSDEALDNLHEYIAPIIYSASDGACKTIDEYVAFITRIAQDSDIPVDNLSVRLNRLAEAIERRTSDAHQDKLAAAISQVRALNNAYESIHKVLPNYEKFVKFKDFKAANPIPKYDKYFDEYYNAELKQIPKYKEFIAQNPERVKGKYHETVFAMWQQERAAIIKHNAEVHERAKDAYRELYRARSAEYANINKQIEVRRNEMERIALSTYSNQLNAAMYKAVKNFIGTPEAHSMFTNSAIDIARVERINELLAKRSLTPDEWREVMTAIRHTLADRKAEVMTAHSVGTALLPGTELTQDSLKYIQNSSIRGKVKALDMYIEREAIEDIANLEGKLYTVKLSKQDSCNYILSKPSISRVYNDIVDCGALGQKIIEQARRTGETAYGKNLRGVVEDAFTSARYLRVQSAIKESKVIPEQLKEALVDKIFAVDSNFRYAFEYENLWDEAGEFLFTDQAIQMKSEGVSKTWIIDALKHVSGSNHGLDNMFRELGCNEADTAENVRKIAELYDSMKTTHAKYISDARQPLFYSLKKSGESSAILEFSILTQDGVHTFKQSIYATREEQQKFMNDIYTVIEQARQLSAKQSKSIQLVGFNNHRTGFDTDGYLSKQLHFLGEGRIYLGDTLDLADLKRYDLGLPVIAEGVYHELDGIIKAEFSRWFSDVQRTGCEFLTPAIAPSMYARKTSDFLNSFPEHMRFMDADEYVVFENLSSLADDLRMAMANVRSFNVTAIGDGVLFAKHQEDIMPLIRDLTADEQSMFVQVKRVYDDKVVTRYFDRSTITLEHAQDMYDFASECDEVMNRMQNYATLHAYRIRINSMFKAFTQDSKNVQAFLEKYGLTFKGNLSLREKFSIIYVLNAKLGFMSGTDIWDACAKRRVKNASEILGTADSVFLRGKGKLFNPYQKLHGMAVEEMSSLNRANTILQCAEDFMQGYDRYMSMLEAREAALKKMNLSAAGSYSILRAQASQMAALRAYVQRVAKSIEDLNEEVAQELAKAKSMGEIQYQQALRTHMTGYDLFKRENYKASVARDHARLVHISTQTPEDVLKHLIVECNGRMVIDKMYVDVHAYDTLIGKLKDVDPRVRINFDGRFARVWYDITGMSDEELLALIENVKGFTLPKLSQTTAELNTLARTSPASFSYGMFDLNTVDRVHYFDKKFFADCEGTMLTPSMLHQLGSLNGTYNCMYHGDISVLTKDNLYLSNDMFANVCVAYSRNFKNLDNVALLVDEVYGGKHNFSDFVHAMNEIDGVYGYKNIAKAIEDNGYVVSMCTTTARGDVKVVQLDISNRKLFDKAMKLKHTAVLRYDEFRDMVNKVEFKNISRVDYADTHRVLLAAKKKYNWYNTHIRQPFIKSYLFLKYATWVRNSIDSPLKASLKEGPVHFQYLREAIKVDDAYRRIETEIYDLYKKVDLESVNAYYKTHSPAMTKQMFNDMRSYYSDPISGTMMEDVIRSFNVDPVRIMRRYIAYDISDEALMKVLGAFEDVTAQLNKGTLNSLHEYEAVRAAVDGLVDEQLTHRIMDLYNRYKVLVANQTMPKDFFSKFKPLEKLYDANSQMFSGVERLNRTAIFLKHMDEGDNLGQAIKAIGETQFDYTKSDLMTAVEAVAPFTTFTFYNIKYWLDSVWNYHSMEQFGDILQMYTSDISERDEEMYWSEGNMAYRAQLMQYFDSPKSSEDDDDDDLPEYDSILDYTGAAKDTALENGWLRIGDRLYLKSGASFIDAFSLIPELSHLEERSAGIRGMIETVGNNDRLFAPLQSLITLALDASTTDEDIQKYIETHIYELTSVFPVVGTLYYSMYGVARNANAIKNAGTQNPEDFLAVISPSLFGLGKAGETGTGTVAYLDRPIGFDWYNQTQEYRDTHRYVVGVSYIPAWISKDPASYIDTVGRMQQLGMSRELVQELMAKGGAWWFTKEGDGYALHNYELMVKNEDTWNKIRETLLSYGWTEEQADALLASAAVPTWQYSLTDYRKYKGYGSFADSASRGALYKTQAQLKANLNRTKYNLARYKNDGNGKWQQWDTQPKTYRQHKMYLKGHDVANRSRNYQKAYRWHRRNRDIYHDNYAKYGASRMAMEQNLRAYSNRSITEMRRTNMNIRYARIHNRWWASR